ncbi:MAG: iron ABC transporter substrate-binding protein [Sphingobium sp.]|nr:MAG: iron ABC transporter substrate-binding protein [Sphingobium sp.]
MKRVIRIVAVLASLAVPATAAIADRPAGYPRSYEQLIADARTERQVVVYANADTAEMAPLILAFQRRYPGVIVRYTDLGSNEMFRRFVTEARTHKPSADLVWSSAMDQQVKLINDGFAQAYASPEKPALPPSAVWKNMGFGVTAEPIAYVYNKKAIPNPPRSHAALEAMLRKDRRTLMGKVATFDPARSNTGYLYLTQDYAITADTRSLVQAMAATRPALSITTEPMLRGVAEGRLSIAYNVIGSYALERARRDPRIGVVFPQDYTIIMSRIAFIAREARHPAAAKLFLDFLLSRQGQSLLAQHSLWPVRTDIRGRRLPAAQARPVRVGPQLLANLDRLKRQRFLREWNAILATGAK